MSQHLLAEKDRVRQTPQLIARLLTSDGSHVGDLVAAITKGALVAHNVGADNPSREAIDHLYEKIGAVIGELNSISAKVWNVGISSSCAPFDEDEYDKWMQEAFPEEDEEE
jgi:hypothetical protein